MHAIWAMWELYAAIAAANSMIFSDIQSAVAGKSCLHFVWERANFCAFDLHALALHVFKYWIKSVNESISYNL